MSQIISAIRKHAKQRPFEIALRSGQISTNICEINYQELSERIDKIAQEFKEKNIHRIGLYLDNSIEWILSDLAAIQAGITIIPIPLFFSSQQLNHLIKNASLDALIINHEWLDSVSNPIVLDLSKYQNKEVSAKSLNTLNASIIRLNQQEHDENKQLRNTFKITYTSGSTGDPKGVCLSLETIESVALALQKAVKPLAIKKHLCIMPMATLLENIAGVYVPLLEGCMVQTEQLQDIGLSLSSGLNTSQFIYALNTIRPHSLIALPQLLKLLVNTKKHPQNEFHSSFSYLRFIAVGGGKSPLTVLKQALELDLPVYEGYGLSECSSVLTLNTPEFNRIGSVGKPLLTDTVSIGENNEVIVNDQVMQGYLSPTGEVSHSSRSINTGDLGYFDNDGFLYLNGRKKNLIISSFGRNISPEWVESELEAIPLISLAVIFGEAKPFLTAIISAPPEIDQNQINILINICNQRLPDYAQIGQWLRADKAFTLRNGLLTYNGRPKRLAIYKIYENRIEDLYLGNSKKREINQLENIR